MAAEPTEFSKRRFGEKLADKRKGKNSEKKQMETKERQSRRTIGKSRNLQQLTLNKPTSPVERRQEEKTEVGVKTKKKK